jgi:hypothetical protein
MEKESRVTERCPATLQHEVAARQYLTMPEDACGIKQYTFGEIFTLNTDGRINMSHNFKLGGGHFSENSNVLRSQNCLINR